jgi:hypothetical protein
MPLTVQTMQALFSWTNQKPISGFKSASDQDALQYTVAAVAGCNEVWFEARALPAGNTQVYNLQSLTDALGTAIVATKFFGMMIAFPDATTLQIKPDTTNGFGLNLGGTSPVYNMQPGWFGAAQTGPTTVSGSNCQIDVKNTGSATANYSIVFFLGQ